MSEPIVIKPNIPISTGGSTDADTVDGKHASDLMALTTHTSTNSGADLNTLTNQGFFRVVNSSANYPTGYTTTNEFILEVLNNGSTSWVRQVLYDVNSNKIFSRSKVNGVWQSWIGINTYS
jgi:hypothetical protein